MEVNRQAMIDRPGFFSMENRVIIEYLPQNVVNEVVIESSATDAHDDPINSSCSANDSSLLDELPTALTDHNYFSVPTRNYPTTNVTVEKIVGNVTLNDISKKMKENSNLDSSNENSYSGNVNVTVEKINKFTPDSPEKNDVSNLNRCGSIRVKPINQINSEISATDDNYSSMSRHGKSKRGRRKGSGRPRKKLTVNLPTSNRDSNEATTPLAGPQNDGILKSTIHDNRQGNDSYRTEEIDRINQNIKDGERIEDHATNLDTDVDVKPENGIKKNIKSEYSLRKSNRFGRVLRGENKWFDYDRMYDLIKLEDTAGAGPVSESSNNKSSVVRTDFDSENIGQKIAENQSEFKRRNKLKRISGRNCDESKKVNTNAAECTDENYCRTKINKARKVTAAVENSRRKISKSPLSKSVDENLCADVKSKRGRKRLGEKFVEKSQGRKLESAQLPEGILDESLVEMRQEVSILLDKDARKDNTSEKDIKPTESDIKIEAVDVEEVRVKDEDDEMESIEKSGYSLRKSNGFGRVLRRENKFAAVESSMATLNNIQDLENSEEENYDGGLKVKFPFVGKSQTLRPNPFSSAERKNVAKKKVKKEFKIEDLLTAKQLGEVAVINTSSRPYKCAHCGRLHRTKKSLEKHLITHESEKPFRCLQCKRAFSRRQQLFEHTRGHLAEKPFACANCGLSYVRKRELLTHIKTHTGKGFRCDECGRFYKYQSSLWTHQLNHTGLRPFKCALCDGTFVRERDVKRHMSVHAGLKPYRCDRCGGRFTRKEHLLTHMLRHQEKPFDCAHCKMFYLTKDELYYHIRRHMGKTPFKCVHCGVRFSWQQSFRRHLLVFHGIGKESELSMHDHLKKH